LKEIGSENTFIRLRTVDGESCINKLFALEGAVQEIRWHGLDSNRKAEFQEFYNMILLYENNS